LANTSSSQPELPITTQTPVAAILDVFADLDEAKQLIESWRREYNESRPHRSLGERTPSEFASQIAASRDLAEA
jgi:hypothetical protein